VPFPKAIIDSKIGRASNFDGLNARHEFWRAVIYVGGSFEFCKAENCHDGFGRGTFSQRVTPHMSLSRESHSIGTLKPLDPPAMTCHAELRDATQGPHERMHLHAGFSAVKDGTIDLVDYRALVTRLYGFYAPFERAIGVETIRTQWLASDLAWLGTDVATIGRHQFCSNFPPYRNPARRLGAQYVVEGAALGGRQLYRGLGAILSEHTSDGRRFFAGRGAGTGDAWLSFLAQIAIVGSKPPLRASLVSAAVETFDIFESWLGGWSDSK
jgi:heme oxygenase